MSLADSFCSFDNSSQALKNPVYLHLDFDNMETASVPFSRIAFLDALGITENFVVSNGTVLHHGKIVDEFLVIFQKDALKDILCRCRATSVVVDISLHQRLLEIHDLVSFRIEFSDGSEVDYTLLWEDDGDKQDVNRLMSAFINNGNQYCGHGGFVIHVGMKCSYDGLLKG